MWQLSYFSTPFTLFITYFSTGKFFKDFSENITYSGYHGFRNVKHLISYDEC